MGMLVTGRDWGVCQDQNKYEWSKALVKKSLRKTHLCLLKNLGYICFSSEGQVESMLWSRSSAKLVESYSKCVTALMAFVSDICL